MSLLFPHLPPTPSSSQPGSLLRDLLANPQAFGPPVNKSTFALSTELRTVLPGPPSPPRDLLRLDTPVSKPVLFGDKQDGTDTPTPTSTPKKGLLAQEREKEKERERNEEVGEASTSTLTPTKKKKRREATRARDQPPISPPTGTNLSNVDAHSTSAQIQTQTPSSSKLLRSPSKPSAGHSSSASNSTAGSSLHPGITDDLLIWPAAIVQRKRPGAGLLNPSMACYANATLQVMLHTPPFVKQAVAHEPGDCLMRSDNKFCMLCIMRGLVLQHWTQPRYAPKTVHQNLGAIKKGFNKNRQEDSHEFFRFVCDALQNTALAGHPKDLSEKIKHTTWVHRLWGGRVRSRVVCSRCTKPSDTYDHFLDLSLDCGQGRRSLLGMLQGFCKEDKLEGDNKYHCESCKAKANATKSFRIAEAPPVLTLHLKRFSVNYNSYNGRARADKYNQHIAFDEYLDIAPYMVDQKVAGPSTKYRLFGVTCHRGAELRFGHYTAYVRGTNDAWYQADDEDVSSVKLSDVLHDKTAYLLSYIRLKEGEDVPERKPNGSASASVNGQNGEMGKRKREDDEVDHRPTKNGGTPRPAMIGPQRPISPAKPSTPLFHSKLNDNVIGNGYAVVNGHSPTSAQSDETPEVDNDAIASRFGEEMHQPKPRQQSSLHASPMSRPRGPGPDAERGQWGGKGRKYRGDKHHPNHRRGNGAPIPFIAGQMRSGGKGFRGKQKGMFQRMKA